VFPLDKEEIDDAPVHLVRILAFQCDMVSMVVEKIIKTFTSQAFLALSRGFCTCIPMETLLKVWNLADGTSSKPSESLSMKVGYSADSIVQIALVWIIQMFVETQESGAPLSKMSRNAIRTLYNSKSQIPVRLRALFVAKSCGQNSSMVCQVFWAQVKIT